jgi:hypothetical protein
MEMFENGIITSCYLAYFPKAYSKQKSQVKFVIAPNCHCSLETENKTPEKHGKQEPLCAISVDEYALMTNVQQFKFEKAIEEEQRWYIS